MKTSSLTADERRRAEFADAAAMSGARGVPWLISHLTDPSWAVRRRVVAALGKIGGPAVEALCSELRDKRDSETRIAAAVDALVASTADVANDVLALTTDPSPAVVADAAQILGRRRARGAISRLAELLSATDDNVAVVAIEALGRIGGSAAVTPLIDTVKSGNFFRRFPAIDVLGRAGDPRATPVLAGLLGDPRYVLEAARALSRNGDKAATGPLVTLLAHPSNGTVRVAAVALHDLAATYAARYGTSDAVLAEVAQAAPPSSVRRLTSSIEEGTAAEQVAICHLLGEIGSEDALAPLVARLDADPQVARAAAEALRRMGDVADGEMVEALRSGDSARRSVLLSQIVARRSAVDAVTRCLEDPDGAVRALACDVLARIGEPSSVPAIFSLLSDPNARVAQASVAAIQALGSENTEALTLQAAASSDARTRRQALRIIGYFGYASGLPSALEAVRSDDAQLRDAGLAALPFVDGVEARTELLARARDTDAHTRASAIRSLGHGEPSDDVERTLVSALDDEDRWVRYYACRSLGRLRCERATSAVAARLSDPAGQVRVGAIEALSHLSREEAWKALELAARSSEAEVQRAAILALGLAGRADAPEVLFETARSPDAATRLVSASALASFRGPRVIDALVSLALDTDDGVRSAALAILSEAPSREATEGLIRLLNDDRTSVRARSGLALSSPGRVAGITTELASVADDDVANALTAALARMASAESIAALLDTLANGSSVARRSAAITLGAVFGSEARSALAHAADVDPDADVRRVAAIARGE